MAEFRQIKTINHGDSSAVITHGLFNVNAVLTACTPGGWPARPFITARDANSITVTFGVEAPPTGVLTLDCEVRT